MKNLEPWYARDIVAAGWLFTTSRYKENRLEQVEVGRLRVETQEEVGLLGCF